MKYCPESDNSYFPYKTLKTLDKSRAFTSGPLLNRNYGADVHKGFDKNAGTVQSYLLKRTFFYYPLLQYNILAKEDFC